MDGNLPTCQLEHQLVFNDMSWLDRELHISPLQRCIHAHERSPRSFRQTAGTPKAARGRSVTAITRRSACRR